MSAGVPGSRCDVHHIEHGARVCPVCEVESRVIRLEAQVLRLRARLEVEEKLSKEERAEQANYREQMIRHVKLCTELHQKTQRVLLGRGES